MTKAIAPILLFILCVLLAFAAAGEETVTLTGEVVDLHCYTARGAHGEEHAGCSNACLARNVPAGLLVDGQLYLLLNEKPVVVNEKVAGLAGKTVKATGKVVERNGLKALMLETVEQ